jgi:hypothetical protein
MSPRKKIPAAEPSPISGKKATVILERGPIAIRIDDLDATEVFTIAAELLAGCRLLSKLYPEVLPILEAVPGGTPVEVTDDDWSDEGRGRVGFTLPRP